MDSETPVRLITADIENRKCLEQAANLALEFGALVMECGATARRIEEVATQVAVGLGAEVLDLRVGYDSISITVDKDSSGLTRMCRVGVLGVNQSLLHSLQTTAALIEKERFDIPRARSELEKMLRTSKPHPDWLSAIAVGFACAAFGRLLGVDWAAVGPILVAATLSQLLRRQLARHHVNVLISTLMLAFVGSLICGISSRWMGSQTVLPAMIATVLLLVPGVPAFNAQFDILLGRPTLGSARAVWVMMTLVYMTLGVWLAQGILREGR